MRRLPLLTLAACTALLAVTGCSATLPAPSAETRAVAQTATQKLERGDCHAVDPAATPAAGPTVLTVRGLPTKGGTASLNMAALDALPQVECTVDDRIAEGTQVRFRGVLLSTLLTHLGATSATTLSAAALNDYAVDLPMSDVTDLPVLLATRMDDRPMSVAHYGPLRVIYPTTGYNLDPTVYDPRRIWQLSSIDLR